jgi:DNA-binding CsgD family transcriptional regulator
LVAGAGEMLIREGDEAPGLELLHLALRHPASDHQTKAWAHKVIVESGLPPDVAPERGGVGDLSRTMTVLHDTLPIRTELGIRALLEKTAVSAQPARATSYPEGLTEREVEVLRLIAKGRTNRAIAEELFITENTVANHVKNVLSKTQSANRTEAAAYAIDKNLV